MTAHRISGDKPDVRGRTNSASRSAAANAPSTVCVSHPAVFDGSVLREELSHALQRQIVWQIVDLQHATGDRTRRAASRGAAAAESALHWMEGQHLERMVRRLCLLMLLLLLLHFDVVARRLRREVLGVALSEADRRADATDTQKKQK
jgi:hypothetical protein